MDFGPCEAISRSVSRFQGDIPIDVVVFTTLGDLCECVLYFTIKERTNQREPMPEADPWCFGEFSWILGQGPSHFDGFSSILQQGPGSFGGFSLILEQGPSFLWVFVDLGARSKLFWWVFVDIGARSPFFLVGFRGFRSL